MVVMYFKHEPINNDEELIDCTFGDGVVFLAWFVTPLWIYCFGGHTTVTVNFSLCVSLFVCDDFHPHSTSAHVREAKQYYSMINRIPSCVSTT